MLYLDNAEEIKELLKTDKGVIHTTACALRNIGFHIKKDPETEQAEVLYWFLTIYERRGADWQEAARKFLVGETRTTLPDSGEQNRREYD